MRDDPRLDTATEPVAGGAAHRRDDDGATRSHRPRAYAARLLPMIGRLARARGAGLTARGLDAVAFGRGPGAFTGLRIAASVAQGLAYAAAAPRRARDDLAAVAAARRRDATRPGGHRSVLACQDARMGEVYCGVPSLADRGGSRAASTPSGAADPDAARAARRARRCSGRAAASPPIRHARGPYCGRLDGVDAAAGSPRAADIARTCAARTSRAAAASPPGAAAARLPAR